jgi:hypothetical protein
MSTPKAFIALLISARAAPLHAISNGNCGLSH